MMQDPINMSSQIDDNDHIAIIGMSVRLPGCKNLDQFWHMIENGKYPITDLTDDMLVKNGVSEDLLKDPQFVKRAFMLENIEKFDADFFRLSPHEAALMDPQFRLVLETAWQALENAGQAPDKLQNPVGVFTATGTSSYLLYHLMQQKSGQNHGNLLQSITLTEPDFPGAWLAYFLDLTGPVMGVRSACSSSLVALSQAVDNLRNWHSDMAIVSAASVALPQGTGYRYQQGSILSPDGICRPFDKAANGTLNGNGAVTLILKRLADAQRDGDRIDAVICGSAVNNDGRHRMGFMAPGHQGQENVIHAALADAEISAENIGYIETHGTGTNLGDPIEYAVLHDIFGQADTDIPCYLGSLKANFGHLNAAAGLAGVAKSVLCLKHSYIPPLAHLETPHPDLKQSDTRLHLPKTGQYWEATDQHRYAAISSFGFGGTNAHVILQQAPTTASEIQKESYDRIVIDCLKITAKSQASFQALCEKYRLFFEKMPDADFSAHIQSLNAGRADLRYRCLLPANSPQDLLKQLDQVRPHDTERDIENLIFVFSGQGGLKQGCAAAAAESSPIFAQKLTEINENFQKRAPDLSPKAFLLGQIAPAGPRLHQAALFSLQFALAEMLRQFGYKPTHVLGHSLGEIAAAYFAEILDLPTAIDLVLHRATAMEDLQEKGKMMAVEAPYPDIKARLDTASLPIDIAAINGTKQIVLSGPETAIKLFQKSLDTHNILSHILETDAAFHSHLMMPAVTQFDDMMPDFMAHPGKTTFISTVSAQEMTERDMEKDYWARQMRAPVLFSEAIQNLPGQADSLYVEIGNGTILRNLIAAIHPEAKTLPGLTHLGCQAYCHAPYLEGSAVTWHRPRYPKPGPDYAFDRQHHWVAAPHSNPIEIPNISDLEVADQPSQIPVPIPSEDQNETNITAEIEDLIIDGWQQVLGNIPLESNSDFFDVGGTSIAAIQIVDHLKLTCEIDIALSDFLQLRTVTKIAHHIQVLLLADLDLHAAEDS